MSEATDMIVTNQLQTAESLTQRASSNLDPALSGSCNIGCPGNGNQTAYSTVAISCDPLLDLQETDCQVDQTTISVVQRLLRLGEDDQNNDDDEDVNRNKRDDNDLEPTEISAGAPSQGACQPNITTED
ncbi:unnamed protein product [Protopolystoma xenopodis]|uniref:Uncharacterized protein n=1 Tax=Protopolystoma xenopodis TaxID=117903 RepID=A0A448WGP6_9PLAT|nr:unnamed protein product [Protopolystoma xenopodis]